MVSSQRGRSRAMGLDVSSVLPFEQSAAESLRGLQKVVRAVIRAVPGESDGATSLSKAMSIQFSLAWKLWRFAEEGDLFVGGQHVPGRLGLKRFCEAAGSLGIDEALIDGVNECFRSFEHVVHLHAGDRATFDIMLASHTEQTDPRADLVHRKQAFRANSYILGLHASTMFGRFALGPSELDPDYFDVVVVHGYVDLKRLRPSAPWRTSRGTRSTSGGSSSRLGRRELLFPCDGDSDVSAMHELPLLHDYCSKPLPEFEKLPGRSDVNGYQLASGAVGQTNTTSFLFGEVLRCAQERYHRNVIDPVTHFRQRVRTPVELGVLELVFHREAFAGEIPRFDLFTQLFETGSIDRFTPSERIHIHERPILLESAGSAPACSAIPHYDTMTRRMFERLQWDPADYSMLRIEIQYPPIPSGMFFSYELENQPRD